MRTRISLLISVTALLVATLGVTPLGRAVADVGATAAKTPLAAVGLAKKKPLKRGPRGYRGPPGPQGPAGPRGPAGPSTGPAGGDLSGAYPNPLIAASAVTSAKVADDSLTGDDVKESTLGAVPNASALGGVAASEYVRHCQFGSIHGFALIQASSTFTTTYQSVPGVFNCGGGYVWARRVGTGGYYVRFDNNPAALAFGNVWLVDDAFITISPTTDGLDGKPSFQARVWDSDGTAKDDPFVIVLP